MNTAISGKKGKKPFHYSVAFFEIIIAPKCKCVNPSLAEYNIADATHHIIAKHIISCSPQPHSFVTRE